MQKRNRRRVGMGLLCLLLLLTGCGKTGEEEAALEETKAPEEITLEPNTVLLKIDGKEVTYEEVQVYRLGIREMYEEYLGENIWQVAIDEAGTSFDTWAVEQLRDQIIQVKVLAMEAEKEKIQPGEEEQKNLMAAVSSYCNTLGQEKLDAYGLNQDIIEKVYEDNLLAETYFEVKTTDQITSIPDEEARQVSIASILVKGSMEEAEKVYQEAEKAEDFAAYAATVTEAEEITQVLGADKEEVDPALLQAALSLKTGEISQPVSGTEGYYIVYCINDLDPEATANRKNAIVLERQKAAFAALYETIAKDYPVVFYQNAWNSLTLE